MTLVKWIMDNTSNDVCEECIKWSIYNYSTCFYFCEICRFPRASFPDLTESCLNAALEVGSGGVILSILCSTKSVNPPSEERLKKILSYALECQDEAILSRLKEMGVSP
ncbi:hypothetical protein TVAG_153280 [Trichomonas vaginalis G3]|uniref:Uncharacterized protein n=1 Tax=Trichomonas vaginalis (strain ATCC PRA-98 / G3) TaxID=412133 RepID=A2FYY2_TRIV3|nr:hypothetical protein TVAGG3_0521160 [Trichomonas vaginalis G3]EAX89883.1 hypothetical protein TVAG_153280 [Trichomonas vaginalis G3]KAI5518459.1 hypothetical protein TVAGG3_0521160 [Trichomonas vaginalis G3]|eukprot:XP_001302813.1 hypothetical protein [Trichomonas vaginalis G3]